MNLLKLLNLLHELRANTRVVAVDIKAKLSLEQLKRIELRHEKAITLLQSLLDSLKIQYGDVSVLYFKQVMVLYGLTHLIKEEVPTTAEPYSQQGEYGEYYTHDLYQTLLPVCRLVHLDEKNGVAEQHAFQLSLIFKDQWIALRYLEDFAKGKKSDTPLHDACLFDLPAPSSCNFIRWKKLANQRSSAQELMMLSPYFREILPHAAILERMEQEGQGRVLDKKAIQEKEQEVIAGFKAFRTLLQTPRDDDSEAQKEQRKAQLSVLSQNLLALRLELTKLSQGTLLEELSIPMFQAFYAAYQEQVGQEYKILVQHGLSEQAKKLFLTLKPENSDEYIPNLFIAGSELGYPGFYLKKLDVLDPKGAALAACLGKITGCCQYLGGVGAACAIHGINSPLGGFYVVCRGDEGSPAIDDPIIAQSWVWRSGNGMLCLDSIERASSADKNIKLVADMYRHLGLELCRQPNIVHVNTGAQSGVTEQVALNNYPVPNLHPVDYTGYRDSHSQLLLAHKDMPYAFYGRVTSVSLQSIINDRTTAYFKAIFSQDDALQDNPSLHRVIAFLIHSKQDSEQHQLFQLLITHAGAQAAVVQKIIEINRLYLNGLERGFIDFNALKKGAYVHAKTSFGSALHRAVANSDMSALEQLLALKINLDIQNHKDETALHEALNYLRDRQTEAARAIAKILIDNKAGLDISDKDENTALIIATKHNDLDMVKYLVEHNADLESSDDDMKTAIFWAAENGYEFVFNYLLDKHADLSGISYTDDENILMAAIRGRNSNIFKTLLARKEIDIKHKNEKGKTALYYVLDYSPEWVQSIMEQCPESQRLDMIKVAGNEGTLLHSSMGAGHNVKTILAMLSEEQRLAVANIRDAQGNTLFHSLVSKNQHFVDGLEVYSRQQRLGLLLRTNNDNQTALHKAARFLIPLKTILALIPKEQQWDEITRADKDGNALLHMAATQPEHLKEILAHLSPEQRLAALSKTNAKGHTVLYCALEHFESVKYLLDLYAEAQKAVEAINETDNNGKNALALVENADSLHYILKAYPEEQRLAVITATIDSDGNNIVHQAHKNSKLLLAILELIPAHERLNAVKAVNNKGQNLLHLTQSFEVLPTILGLYPEDQRLDAVNVVDKEDKTPLRISKYSSSNLKALLELLPEDKKLMAVKMQDKNGDTLLHLANYNDDSMQVILQIYPEEQRLDALMVVNKHNQTSLNTVVRSEKLFVLIPSTQRLNALKLLVDKDTQKFDLLGLFGLTSDKKVPILPLIPQEQRLDALCLFNDGNGDCALHCMKYDHGRIKNILILLTTAQRKSAIQLRNSDGETILHESAYNHETLSAILSLVPEELMEELLLDIDAKGDTVLHKVVRDFKSLQAIIPFIPDGRALDLFGHLNTEGETVLHNATIEPESFRLILSLIPETQRLVWLNKVDNKGYSVLYDAVRRPESMRVIWELVPENQRMDLFQMPNKKGETLLHWAASTSESLQIILDFLLQDQRVIWVEKANSACSLIARAFYDAESIKIILELYPEEQRDKILTAIDNKGEFAMYLIAIFPEALKMALSLIPEGRRFYVIKAVDKNGNSALHGAASNLECLNIVLNLYPEDQRLDAVKRANSEGSTALHRAAYTFECIQTVLNLYPQSQRLDAVRLANKKGKTALHFAVADVNSLEKLLSLYPEDEQLAAISLADEEGHTVLQLAEKHPKSIEFLNNLIANILKQKPIKAPSPRAEIKGVTFFAQSVDTAGTVKSTNEVWMQSSEIREAMNSANSYR
jgi:ankyrin repeat protein